MPSRWRLAATERETSAAARLLLTEALLSTDDPVECAQITVDWLGEHAGARRCLCALLDPAQSKANAVVSFGIQRSKAGNFALALEEPGLVAFARHEPVTRGDRDFLAIPLPVTDAREARLGLLLVAPSRVADARWAATLLGRRLAQERAGRPDELLKSQLLATLSHELRTPLNAILGYTSMLLGGVGGELPPPQKQKLQRVDANGKVLLHIVNDLLDLGRLTAGKLTIANQEFELAPLLHELLDELPPTQLQINLDLPPGPFPLWADRQRVKQITGNLLGNAIKFTPRGSVTISARTEAREVRISVADTGIGIAREDQEKIFEEFRQVDGSVTREYGGAGLGLAICRRLASLLSGRIEVKSEPGRGSVFTLALPRKGKRR